jgi:hypothetical protein
VEALKKISSVVEVVEAFDGVGHCPHDEAPELVNPLLLKFLDRVHNDGPVACDSDAENTSASSSKKLYFTDTV